jgi:hypothetical protein
MDFDVLLPLILFLTLLATLFLYFRSEKKIGSVFQEVKFRYYHGILLVLAMSVMVAVLVLVPSEAILILYLCVYFSGFFFFTYLFVPKWYLAPVTPILFIAFYFARAPYWNLFTFNLFGIIFAIFISVYLGSLFTWKTTAVFVGLLTIMDIVNVLVTGFIPRTAEKIVKELGLPVIIQLPMFPSVGYIILGLGDIFLAGLLSIQSAKKYGKKFGFASIAAITLVFSILITVLLNYYDGYFPATVLVISGWLTALAGRQLYRSSLLKRD